MKLLWLLVALASLQAVMSLEHGLGKKLLKLAILKKVLTSDHHDSSSSDDHHDSSSSDDHHDSSSSSSHDHHDSSSSSHHDSSSSSDHSDDSDDHEFPLARKLIKLAIVKKLIDKHHDSDSDDDDHHDSDDDHHDSDDDSDHHEFPLAKKLLKLAVLKKVLGGGKHHEKGGILKTLIKAKILKAVAEKLHGDDDDHDHTWTFAMGDDFGAYNYLDDEGHLQGFNVDLMKAVCHHAHKKCNFIEDKFSHCWHNDHIHESPGEGLLDGWYDGCFGFESTPERLNSFDFTDDYSEKEHSSLHYRTGDPPLTDLQGKKIGFVHGWASSVHCLEREGKAFQNHAHTNFIAQFYQDHDELEEALVNKSVDAVFSEDVFDHDAEVKKGVEQDTHEMYCSDHGEAIMTRHDSPLVKWWNKAFKSFHKSGGFKTLCAEAKKNHGKHGVVHCDL